MGSLKWWMVILCIAVVAVIAYFWASRTKEIANVARPQQDVNTTVDMTILGGFTYVHSTANRTYEVAYLNQVKKETCDVPRLHVTLKVINGTITSPSPPPNKTFDLNGAVVTFSGSSPSGTASGNGPGTLSGSDQPTDPDDPTKWEDLKYVPNIFRKFPGSPIASNWRTLPVVNGRVVLTNGTLKGGKPTYPEAVRALWDFKKLNASGAPDFTQAVTNETLYRTTLPGASLTITLTRTTGTTAIVIASNSGHVELSLHGSHPGAPPTLPAGAPDKDFCAFYEILQSPPAVADRLLPHFVPAAAPTGGTVSPLPGPLCGGDFGEQP